MTERTIIRYATTSLLNKTTAARILIELGDILARQERADLALTGGMDAADIYTLMGTSDLAADLDWKRVHLWWSDERFVSPDDPERNAKQARDAWFGRLVDDGELPADHVHEMPADIRTPEQIATANEADDAQALAQAARTYQDEIIRGIGPNGHMDLAVFGVGPDGHYASLFPDRPEVLINDETKLVAGIDHSPKLPPLRVTMTTPFIRRTPKVWLFTSTREKAEAVKEALGGVDNPHVPSSFARGTEQTLWLLDEDAAGLLG
ncbi:6-phosphogluconolactonase [Bifidobacterium indicum]|uniref:6-phosphogluconolactonase n=1 Tax=Bifidobacterium indicum TaxID=1691 RepID=UPI0030D75D6D